MSIGLRPVEPEDIDFLQEVYSSTRADEMQLVAWDTDTKVAFLRQQFSAQHKFYLENYPGARFFVILLHDEPIGRLYVHEQEHEIRIMDITVLPEHRNKGIGSFLLNQVLTQAANSQMAVTIHVEQFNPARHFYERLGFWLVEERSVYLFMKWTPAPITREHHEYTR